MKTRSMAAAFLMMTTSGLTLACGPAPGTCTDSADCAFGQVCHEDGVCVIASQTGEARFGVALRGQSEDPVLGQLVSTFSTTGSFEGSIGGDRVETADVRVDVYSRGLLAWFSKEGANATFLAVNSVGDFSSPGERSYAVDVYSGNVQACNYNTTAYDEWFPSFDVEVTPPRDATADDPIIAEDTVTTVADVTIGVAGEGSDVTVTFAMPLE